MAETFAKFLKTNEITFKYAKGMRDIQGSEFHLFNEMFFFMGNEAEFFSETIQTSQVGTMESMFSQCKSLISLNLSNFDTTHVTNMNSMFQNCHNLKYLDISNFSSLNIRNIEFMFQNLSSLIYLNLDSFEIQSTTSKNEAFDLIPQTVKFCTNPINLEIHLSQNDKMNDCSDICFIKNIKLDIIRNECIH